MKFGPLEIGLILLIILIIFGAGKLPQVGEAMGKSIRNFRKAQTSEDEEEAKTAKTLQAPEKTPTNERSNPSNK